MVSFRRIALLAFVAISVAAATGAAGTPPPAADAADGPPNILFLFADDQRADAVGAYGNPYIDTPNLDRLTRVGFNFRRAYVMGSHHGAVCAPSRAMLLSGRSLYRVYDDLDTVETFPEVMRARGYTTFATGKWHQSRASFRRIFDHGRAVFFGGMSDHRQVPLQDLRADGTLGDVRRDGFSTTRFADAAIDFLVEHAERGSDAPFLAYVSFTAPHDPRTPPPAYAARYAADGMPLPPSFMPQHPFDNGRLVIRDEVLAGWPRPPDVVRAQLAEYYGLITHLDAEVGRILDALMEHGFAENTVVVFAADNGLALGSHGLLGKQNLYEHSTRVPLVVAGPGIPHGESEALVYLYDLFPTLAGVAGVPDEALPDGVEGRDLAPVWQGERPGVRESLFTVYEDIQRAVRDGRWKLIRYPKVDHTQLFDLASDPYELRNLAGDPAHADRVARMNGLLRDWQHRAGDPHPLEVDAPGPMEVDLSGVERTPDPHQPADVVDKYFTP